MHRLPRFRQALLLALALLALLPAAEAQVTRAHGYAAFGDLRYPPGFTRFDWVRADAPRGGSVRLAGDGTFDTLNPYTLKGTSPWNTPGLYMYGIGELNEPLMTGSGDYAPSGDEPASAYGLVAREIEYPRDLSWVVFRLRPEARFHDGHAIDAGDVVFSFNTLIAKGHPRFRDIYRDVVACEALDAHTVRFRFRSKGDRMLPLRVGELPVLPEHWWKGRDFARALLEPPLLSGPYRVGEVDPGRSVTYVRVANYWGRDLPVNRGRWNFDKVRVDFYRDQTVALQAFMAGEYDVHLEYVARNWANAYDTPPVRDGRILKVEIPHRIPAPNQAFFMNARRDLFADRRVREAMAWLYDFEWANANLFNKAYTRSGSWFPNSPFAARGMPTRAELALLEPFRAQLPARLFTAPFALPATRGDGNTREQVRRAHALLAEAGWRVHDGRVVHARTGRPMQFEILVREPSMSRVVLPYIDSLRRAGIIAGMRLLEPAAWKQRVDAHDFDMAMFVLGNSLTPGSELREYLHSSLAAMPGGRNHAGVRNPAVDSLVEAALAAGDREAMAVRMRALDRVLLHEYYAIPGWYLPYHRAAWWNHLGRPPVAPDYILGFQDWYVLPGRTPPAATAQGAGR